MKTNKLAIILLFMLSLFILRGTLMGQTIEEKALRNEVKQNDNEKNKQSELIVEPSQQRKTTHKQTKMTKDNKRQTIKKEDGFVVKKNNIDKAEFYNIVPNESSYKLEGNFLLAGLHLMENETSIVYKITKDNENPWRVITKVFDGKLLVLHSRTKMDSSGSVVEEVSSTKENKGNNTSKEKIIKLSVSIEEQPFLGKGKVVKLQEGITKASESASELMVSINDPITTFLQMVVWISTIKTVPDKGLAFRWVMNGNPLPVIIREIESGDNAVVCYAVFDNKSESFSDIKETNSSNPFVILTYPKQRKGFTMPDKLELVLDSFNVILKKDNSKEL